MMTTNRAPLCERSTSAGTTAARPSATIRPATAADFPAMLQIFRRATASGDTDVHAADTGADETYAYWFGEAKATYVAERDGRVVGMCRIIENQRGRGSHVANASFMVDPGARGQGVGLALGRHCLAEARKDGFLAMQLNMVVSTNTRAVALWKKPGLAVVGTLPGAFRHARLGPVDAYVMRRSS